VDLVKLNVVKLILKKGYFGPEYGLVCLSIAGTRVATAGVLRYAAQLASSYWESK